MKFHFRLLFKAAHNCIVTCLFGKRPKGIDTNCLFSQVPGSWTPVKLRLITVFKAYVSENLADFAFALVYSPVNALMALSLCS